MEGKHGQRAKLLNCGILKYIGNSSLLTGHSFGTALRLELHSVGRIASDCQVLFTGRVTRRRFVLVVFTARPAGGQRFAYVFCIQTATDLVPAEERAFNTFRRRS